MAESPLTRMATASVASCAVMSLLVDRASRAAVFLGMLGPLVGAIGTWMIVERTHARAPESVPAVMIRLFGAKIVLFGAYVGGLCLLLATGTVAFAASFTTQYILLHFMEALYLRRLFSNSGPRWGVS